MFKNIGKRVLQIIAVFLLIIMIIGTVVGAMLGVSFVKVAEGAPDINADSMMLELSENSKIVDLDGNLIESIASEEYREIVKLDQIPKYLQDAFIAVEDQRFKTHNGVDIIGIGRSVLDNLKAGEVVRGGSTITQQLVRNMYLSPDVQWERKIIEMYLAMEVEQELSKEQILEAYMNRVYLGQHAYGVEAGAQTYFSKSVSELSLAEAATLAGMVKGPSIYSLFYSYYPSNVPEGAKVIGDFYVGGENFVAVLNENAFERKNVVLSRMYEQDMISKEEYEKAKAEDVAANVKPGSKKQREYSSNISDLIKKQAIEKIMESQHISRDEALTMLYAGGLTIKTTIDWDVQKKLESVYADFADLFADEGSEGSPILANFKADDVGDIIGRDGSVVFYKKDNVITEDGLFYLAKGNYAVKENGDVVFNTMRARHQGDYLYLGNFYDVNDDNFLVTYRSGSVQIPKEFIKSKEGMRLVIDSKFFDNLGDFYKIDDQKRFVINDRYTNIDEYGTVQPQSATVIIDHRTGEIRALVGQRKASPDDTINRATDFPRPPGSSIKPLVAYAPALENGYTLATALDDVPLENNDGTIWPRNAYRSYLGLIPLRTALARSVNTTAIKLLGDIGLNTGYEYLEAFGLKDAENPENDNFITARENPDQNDENLSIAIGSMSRGLTVMDMASAYTAFANEGQRAEPMIIRSIDSNRLGNIYTNQHEMTRVVSKETAFLITEALQDTLGYYNLHMAKNDYGIATAGKSGTSDDFMDNWFCGYNEYYTAATWIGFDNNNINMIGHTKNASFIFGQYMKRILEGKEPAKFKKPDTIVTAQVDKLSGLLPNEYTDKDPRGSMVVTEYFDEKTVPRKESNAHVKLKIDKRNGLLASDKTPEFLVEEKIFQKRSTPYIPENFNDIEPEDWEYEAPTKYSNEDWEPEVETIENEDGSITKKTQEFNGDIVEITTYEDGTVITKVTKLDGTTTTEVVEPEDKPDDEEDPDQEEENPPDEGEENPPDEGEEGSNE